MSAKNTKYPYYLLKGFTYYFSVLRIRDVYPGCRILIFTDPGSRISDPKQQQKREVKNNLLSYLYCSYEFHKIEDYFIF